MAYVLGVLVVSFARAGFESVTAPAQWAAGCGRLRAPVAAHRTAADQGGRTGLCAARLDGRLAVVGMPGPWSPHQRAPIW